MNTFAAPPFLRQHQGFPWGIHLGQLHHGASGRVLPALWPTQAGGLHLCFSDATETQACQWIEFAALDLLGALPWRGLRIEVLDLSIRKRFPCLAQLQAQGLYRIEQDSVQRAVADWERLARHRHHQLLDQAAPSLALFNRHAPQPEPYVLLLLHLDDLQQDPSTAQRLTALLQEAGPAGFFCLAYSRLDAATAAAALAQDGSALLKAFMSLRYPELHAHAPDGSAAPAPVSLSIANDAGHEGLKACLAQAGASMTLPPCAPDALMNDLHKKAHAAEKLGPEQDFLSIAIGRTPDGKQEALFSMGALSKAYNAVILGMPGTGKSTLLNNLLIGIAEKYTAQQIRLFLMDYKEGTEFQRFLAHPNVEQIFLDNTDTHAALALLQQFQATISERGQIFKQHNESPAGQKHYVSSIDSYNAAHPDQPLPHLLLVVDEFQRLLGEDNPDALLLGQILNDIGRRGRAAGVHWILATQSFAGIFYPHRLLNVAPLRVSFQLNARSDAESIFDIGNTAPLQLQPYQFIINAHSGRKDSNLLAYGKPAPSIEAIHGLFERLRQTRPPSQCLQARIATSAPTPSPQHTPPLQATAAPASAAPAAPACTAQAMPTPPHGTANAQPAFDYDEALRLLENLDTPAHRDD
ncbi:FtsK/SpoIIIE domain-containing protein [Vandammella animalimorsus]|nr:FtsK/SpoIIIE domain-containing protein [Vandammella animalimorsus]